MRPIKKQLGIGVSIRPPYFRGHFMGPKRGFVTVLNARVLQWSSEIRANAAGVKGLVSVSLPSQRSHPGPKHARG